MMVLMMGLMMLVPIAVAFLLLVLVLGVVRNTGGKASGTYLEKPKRYPLALGDDGELVEINEDATPLLYYGEARQ